MSLTELKAELAELNARFRKICADEETATDTGNADWVEALDTESMVVATRIGIVESEIRDAEGVRMPPPGSWAETAMIMASMPTFPGEEPMDWDAWKDQMKENELG
jgi:hypothetical protein